jgi:hypothetical protein
MCDTGLRVRKKIILKYKCVCVYKFCMNGFVSNNIAAVWTDKMSAISNQPEKSGSKASCWYIFKRYRCNYISGLRLFGSDHACILLAFCLKKFCPMPEWNIPKPFTIYL